MPPREPRYPAGSRVRVADLKELARYQANPKFPHPLEPEQLEHAGEITTVREITYYHDGDPLYRLDKVPGMWHEACLHTT
jgi:hypothetical protein